ncbi:ylmG homolog protein 2, chloroplastic [Arachis stenosperma]|uniref:ylmG homolog protein 2, chloroplastic n=1 Tax=Arachis stenosperma TaxID=217475 RepID=UPI0025AB8AB1|nr:ylmG homolog protein 2, chloroplastic [Arachis stenosperma]
MAVTMNVNESSSTTTTTATEIDEAKKAASFCSVRSWGNPQTPFALPFRRFGAPTSNASPNNHIINIPELRRFMSDAAHDLIRFASQNPVVNKLISLHSQFQSICLQIRRSSLKSMGSVSGSHNFAAVLPGGDSVAGLVVSNGILNFLNIYNTLLVVRLVLTWFPNSPPAIVSPLSTICDPYLNIFRGLIPPLGGTLDLSPILAFLVLNAFTNTAAALPAELPAAEQSEQRCAPPLQPSDVTTFAQKKWLRRLQGNNRSKSSDRVN